MVQELELELESGGCARLSLPEPGEFLGSFVSPHGSGRLAALQFRGGPAPRGTQRGAAKALLLAKSVGPARLRVRASARRGPGLKDLFGPEKQKLLFVRNPIEVQALRYRALMREGGNAPASFAQFLRSPEVEHSFRRYQGLAELRRHGGNVGVFRAEHAFSDWHALVSDVLVALRLPIDAGAAASITAARSPIRRQAPLEEISSAAKEVAEIEARFADVFAVFGYGTWDSGSRKDAGAERSIPTAFRPPAPAGPPRHAPGPLLEFDPVLHARLKPNTSVEAVVLGRRITMNLDATGCRPVIGQPSTGEKTLAV
jgi:hypothetical protein